MDLNTLIHPSTPLTGATGSDPAGTNGAYQATPGWDYVSGFGTPVLTPLIKDIDHGNMAPIQER